MTENKWYNEISKLIKLNKMSNEKRDLLSRKLNALRLEVDESIVVDIEKTFCDLFDEMSAEIGTLPEGAHPDEIKPRAATWLQERYNWESEVKRLNEFISDLQYKISAQEAIISKLQEPDASMKYKEDQVKQ